MADQFDNAAACARVGVARVLLPDELTEAAVRTAVDALLADDSYRLAARRVAGEIAAQPSPRELADRIEELYRATA
jgi:UDP:flavonoid glycosyltransferase YjiC (YdhE family)